MSQTKSKEPGVERRPKIAKWQERSPVERRADRDKRTQNSITYFVKGGKERRTGKERRHSEERRDRWIRVGKWRSESVFDE
jgi:hypothetical protein